MLCVIIHPIGIPEYFAIGKYKFWYTNHSPIRRYYITRNRFYFIKKYKNFRPDFIQKEKRTFLLQTLKIILFEKEKVRKLKATYLGYKDYKKGVFGKTFRVF